MRSALTDAPGPTTTGGLHPSATIRPPPAQSRFAASVVVRGAAAPFHDSNVPDISVGECGRCGGFDRLRTYEIIFVVRTSSHCNSSRRRGRDHHRPALRGHPRDGQDPHVPGRRDSRRPLHHHGRGPPPGQLSSSSLLPPEGDPCPAESAGLFFGHVVPPMPTNARFVASVLEGGWGPGYIPVTQRTREQARSRNVT